MRKKQRLLLLYHNTDTSQILKFIASVVTHNSHILLLVRLKACTQATRERITLTLCLLTQIEMSQQTNYHPAHHWRLKVYLS